jgi:hypothetical protein
MPLERSFGRCGLGGRERVRTRVELVVAMELEDDPWKALDPDLVTTFTWPAARPNSAE